MRVSARLVVVMSMVFAACPPAVTETLEISPATLTLQTGETRSVSAQVKSGSSSSAAAGATWTSSDEAVLTVSSTGDGTAALQAVAAGTATVTAKLREATATLTVTVNTRTVTLTRLELGPTNASLARGTMLQLAVTGFFSDSTTAPVTDAVFSSADQAVLTVDAAGLVSGLTAGTTQVTATKGTLTASLSVTVTAATLVAIDVTPALPTLAKGTTQQLVATARFSDTTTQDVTSQATWSSSAAAAVTVDGSGLATAVEVGNALISAALNGVSGGTTVTVTAAELTAIDVTPTAPSIPLGLTSQLTATGRFSDGSTQDLTTQATWASATAGTATVSSGGLVTSVAVGTSELSATVGAITGRTTVTVSAAQLASIALTPVAPSIARGLTRSFTATGTFTDTTTQDVTTGVVWSTSAAGTASVSNAVGSQGLVTGQAVGTATITATSGAISANTVVTVTDAVVTSLQVTPTLPSLPLGLTQQFTAMALLSDGSMQDLTTTVTWTTGTASIATISNALGSEGLLTSVAVGTSTVVATLNTVTHSTTVTVTAARLDRIDVTPMAPTVALGRTLQLTATGVYSDASTQDLTNAVTWTTSPTGRATVSSATGSEGLLTTVSVGTTTVTATLGTVSGNQTVIVSAAELVSLAVTPTNPSVAKGLTQQFTAMGTFSDNTTQNLTTAVTWSSTNGAALGLSNAAGSEGLATALQLGSGDVTAQLSGVTGTASFTVTAAALVSIAVTPLNPSIAKGLTQQFTATGTFSDATTQNITTGVTWASATAANATISNAPGSEGLATGVELGTSSISATSGTVVGSTTLTVGAAQLMSITVTPSAPTINLGSTLQFTATGTYSDTTTRNMTAEVTWASTATSSLGISNAVGSEGLATTVAVGTSTVSATSGSVSGSTLVTVSNATLVSIAVTPADSSAPKGLGLQFLATGTYSDTTTQDLSDQVIWASSDETVASVSNGSGTEGLATALAEGTATISATFNSVTGSTGFTVDPPVLVGILLSGEVATLPLGRTAQLVATGLYSDASLRPLTTGVTWSATPSGLATVSSSGLVRSVALGTASITASVGTVTSSPVDIDMVAAELDTIAITGTPATLAMGRTAQLTATGTYSDATTGNLTTQVTWLATPAATATISNSTGTQGRLTALAIGTASLTATLGSVTGSASVDVTAAELVSIAVTPVNPTVFVGATSQLTATGTYTDATTQDLTSTATWTSVTPAIATVSSGGLVTGVAAGNSQINAVVGSITGSTSVTVPMPPAVSVTSPASAAIGVSALTSISVTFTMAMSPATLTTQATFGPCTGSIQVSLNDFASCIPLGAPVMNGANTIATVTPAPALAFGTAYKVRVTTSAASPVGGPLTSQFTLAAPFTTGVDPACGTGLVISQVYGGGGNSGAQYLNDFIELHNPTAAPISITGMAIQFLSAATGGNWGMQALPAGSIPPGGYFLILEGAGSGNGVALPTPDFTPGAPLFTIGATSGKAALTTNTTVLVGAVPPSATIIDLVGFGSTASAFEGTAPAPAPSNTTSVQRKKAGGVDENQNATDFVAAAPVPRNSAVANQLICTRTVNETGTPAELDFCNLQHPPSTSATTGTLTEDIYGRVFENGVTQAAGGDPIVRAQFGYGPLTSNPQNQPGWVWFPGAFNVQIGNDDEYKFRFTAPAPGQYAYTSRFSLDGINWTYCDLSGAGGNAGLSFEPSWLGALTVTP